MFGGKVKIKKELLQKIRRERLKERVGPETGADRRLHVLGMHWALGSCMLCTAWCTIATCTSSAFSTTVGT